MFISSKKSPTGMLLHTWQNQPLGSHPRLIGCASAERPYVKFTHQRNRSTQQTDDVLATI